jgi:hypothetical protein
VAERRRAAWAESRSSCWRLTEDELDGCWAVELRLVHFNTARVGKQLDRALGVQRRAPAADPPQCASRLGERIWRRAHPALDNPATRAQRAHCGCQSFHENVVRQEEGRDPYTVKRIDFVDASKVLTAAEAWS